MRWCAIKGLACWNDRKERKSYANHKFSNDPLAKETLVSRLIKFHPCRDGSRFAMIEPKPPSEETLSHGVLS